MSKHHFILHVGTHKTGTTTIQDTAIRQGIEGINYLDWGKSRRHNTAYTAAFMNSSKISKNEQNGSSKSTDSCDYEMRLGLEDALKKAPEGDPILISAEAIANSKGEHVKLFKDVLDSYALSYRIIIYVRHPEEFAASSIQEALKLGRDLHYPKLYPFRTKLEKFDDLFGVDNVDIYPFDREILKDNDIMVDFSSRLGIEFPIDNVENSNASATAEVCALLYTYWSHRKHRYAISQESWLSWMMIKTIGGSLGRTKLAVGPETQAFLSKRGQANLEWLFDRTTIDYRTPKEKVSSDYLFLDSLDQFRDLSNLIEPKFQKWLDIHIDKFTEHGNVLAYRKRLDDCSCIRDQSVRIAAFVEVLRDACKLAWDTQPYWHSLDSRRRSSGMSCQ